MTLKLPEKDAGPRKRNLLDRTVNIFNNLELNMLYSPPSIRDLLRKKFNDSISPKTIRELLDKIIEAQDKGLKFLIKNKYLKLVEKKTSNKGKLYELIETKE